jgi:hypothetical protein
MFKKIFSAILFFVLTSSSFAGENYPKFVLLPNINTQYIMHTNASEAVSIENQAIELVKKTLHLNSASPYKTVRISLQYNAKHQVDALIVYLLSTKIKSFDLVRINLNTDFSVASVIKDYHLQAADFMQTPAYAQKRTPACPDPRVQFVIGNNFDGDESVENEVQKVFQLAKDRGYNPILMDVNNPNGPQPTIEAYENWMSCPNVKGFYNESHGWEQGILLSDGDFSYQLIDRDLLNQLSQKVTLFDSCETFHDPLLSSMMDVNKGNAQQYIAGIISLPFGPSERTASCFWALAFNGQELNRAMLNDCSVKNDLEIDGFGINGNGDNHLTTASN